MHRVDSEQQRTKRSDKTPPEDFPNKNKNQKNIKEMHQKIDKDIPRRVKLACGMVQSVGKNGYWLIIGIYKSNRGKDPEYILPRQGMDEAIPCHIDIIIPIGEAVSKRGRKSDEGETRNDSIIKNP